MRARWLAHLAVAAWFAALAIWVSYPLILGPGHQVPGRGPEDNISFLWNFWWFRYALATGQPLFETSHLFAPFGAPLVQHTHTALPALVGATLLGWMPLVAAHSAVLLAGLAANGIAAYALAYHQVKRILPAVLAGVVFSSAVFVTLRLLGHFNLVHAWVCPAAALSWIACLDRPTSARGALAGLAFAAAAWTDYYYAIFCGIFAVAWWLALTIDLDVRWAGRRPTVERVLLAFAAVAGIALIVALVSDGIEFRVLGARVSISNASNPIAILWLILLAGLVLRVRASLGWRRRDGPFDPASRGSTLAAVAVAALVAATLILPLALAARELVEKGDYVTPPRHWRSGPRGVDLLTAVTGNPVHVVYGPAVRWLYSTAGIDLVEQTAWLGILPVAAIGLLIADRSGRGGAAGRWLWIGGLFLVWSAGAYLNVAGVDTRLPLPQALAHYVPVLSNARIPGRAIVMVQLAAAVLCAITAARRHWTAPVVVAAVAIVLADNAAAPIPMYRLPEAGPIERAVAADAAAGSVLEIPAGVRDGLSEIGFVEHRALWFQTIHGRPLLGGFAARVPERIKRAYAEDPDLMAILEQREQGIQQNLSRRLAPYGVRFVILNRDKTSEAFRNALAQTDLVFVMADGARELYRVE